MSVEQANTYVPHAEAPFLGSDGVFVVSTRLPVEAAADKQCAIAPLSTSRTDPFGLSETNAVGK